MGICGSATSSNSNPSPRPLPAAPAHHHQTRQTPSGGNRAASSQSAARLSGHRELASLLTAETLPLLEKVCPNNPDYAMVENELLPILQIDNVQNLNHRYSHLYKVDGQKFVGNHIKKTYSYSSRVPIEEIRRVRQEFWGNPLFLTKDTRIEGSRATWDALKYACETEDLGACLLVLEAAGVKLLNKTLQMSYDDSNLRFDLPIFIINDPSEFLVDKQDHSFATKPIKVLLRIPPKDQPVETTTDALCGTLVEKLKAMNMVPDNKQLKIIYSGKEVQMDKPIGFYNSDDQVVFPCFLKAKPEGK